jgi:hypothetical protein
MTLVSVTQSSNGIIALTLSSDRIRALTQPLEGRCNPDCELVENDLDFNDQYPFVNDLSFYGMKEEAEQVYSLN